VAGIAARGCQLTTDCGHSRCGYGYDELETTESAMIGVGLYWMIGMAAATVIVGAIIKWLCGNFLKENEAKIASFAFMFGNSANLFVNLDFGYVSPTEKIGSFIGLTFLWWFLFKRKAATI
jgi:hypothetical protein